MADEVGKVGWSPGYRLGTPNFDEVLLGTTPIDEIKQMVRVLVGAGFPEDVIYDAVNEVLYG